MSALTRWWNELSAREQVLIAAMLVLALGIGFVYGLMKPLERYHSDGIRAYAAASATAARARALAAEAGTFDTTAEPTEPRAQNVSDVRTAISSTARERGIAVSRLQPDSNNRITVWLEDTETNALYAWLEELHRDHGVKVYEGSIQTEDGGQGLRAQFLLGPGS